MLKTTVLAALVGILSATAALPSNAAVLLPKPPKNSSTENCGYQLDYMARVTRATIEAIYDQSVYLVPVCETGNTNDDYGSLFTSGNVNTLRTMSDNIDVDVSAVFESAASIAELGDGLYERIAEVASGTLVTSELLNVRETAVSRFERSL